MIIAKIELVLFSIILIYYWIGENYLFFKYYNIFTDKRLKDFILDKLTDLKREHSESIKGLYQILYLHDIENCTTRNLIMIALLSSFIYHRKEDLMIGVFFVIMEALNRKCPPKNKKGILAYRIIIRLILIPVFMFFVVKFLNF